jgi:hypothetical protein
VENENEKHYASKTDVLKVIPICGILSSLLYVSTDILAGMMWEGYSFAYLNEEGTKSSIIHIFPDVESMEAHMKGVNKLAKKAHQFMEIKSFQIYGRASEQILVGMMQIAGSGVTLDIKPQSVGTYIRLQSR